MLQFNWLSETEFSCHNKAVTKTQPCAQTQLEYSKLDSTSTPNKLNVPIGSAVV